mgnify:CR=1 FL=1|jgi:hypothetical protein
MAQQESMIKLKGRVGDVTFYQNERGYQARSSKGVDPKRVKQHPAFKRSRENSREFGRAAIAAKCLRSALRPLLRHIPDGSMVNRLTSRMVRILKADDVHIRGERLVNPVNVGMLRFFDFNRSAPLHEMLLVRYDVNLDRSENRVELRLPSFYPKQAVVFPKEATHFRLVAATTAIDFSRAPSTSQRPPVAMETTELLSVVGQVPALSFSLPIDESLAAGAVIVLVGISYFESLQGEIYPIKDKESAPLGVVEVY